MQRAYYNPLFSPDGGRIAVTVQTEVGVMGAFVLDIRSGAWTRVDVDEASPSLGSEQSHLVAGWMPDGERLILGGGRVGLRREGLLASIDRSEPPEALPFEVDSSGTSVAPDGHVLLTQRNTNVWDIWRVGLTGERAAEPWLATPSEEGAPSFSPDARWVAYYSGDSGRFEIYVRAYNGSAVRHQVSNQGGIFPLWSRDGREIFFLNEGSLWSAPVRTSTAEPPQKLFDIPEDIWSDFYDVSPDGRTFVMIQRDPLELRPFDLVVIPNWVEEMKSRLASTK